MIKYCWPMSSIFFASAFSVITPAFACERAKQTQWHIIRQTLKSSGLDVGFLLSLTSHVFHKLQDNELVHKITRGLWSWFGHPEGTGPEHG